MKIDKYNGITFDEPITLDKLIEALQEIRKETGGDALVSTEPEESAYDNAVFIYPEDKTKFHYSVDWDDN